MNHKQAFLRLRFLLITSVLMASTGIAIAQSIPTTNTYFICPTVSTNNANGSWVIGGHGGYYVLVPKQGVNGSKVFLTVPVKVFSVAQIPAGWGLYSSLPNYPNFVGTATLLQEGIDRWLADPPGWQEGDSALVVQNADSTYTVTDLTRAEQIQITTPIPLASGAIW